ncbi:MAG: hypothetical protein V4850_31530 [Myxococcota bacterium]
MHILVMLASLAFARPVVVVEAPLVRALELPIAARAIRRAGVPHAEVLVTLDAVRLHRVRAWDLVLVFQESDVAMRTYGLVPDYGVFVLSRLDRGLTGRDLADAIHKDHRAHGHGKYKVKENGNGYKVKGDGYSYKVKYDKHNGSDKGGSSKGGGHGNSGNGGHGKGNDDKGKGKK